MAPDLTLRFESIEELSIARAGLRSLLATSGDLAFTCDAVLAASELLTNCIIHTNDACLLTAWFQPVPPVVRVEVVDCSRDLPHLKIGDPVAGGRGLRIVDVVATRWGVEPRPQGKTVWFEIG